MDFNVNDWLGDWISFEHLINNHDPNLDRAWKDSTKAMRSKPLFAIMMLGDARRFWAKACKTSGKEWRFRIGGWHIEQPSAVGDDDAVAGFNLTWLDEKRTPITTHEYRLDHVHDKGLEGKPCYVFHASDAGASDPFAVLIAMEPMPERSVLRHGGLLSHLHFRYASDEGELIKGTGKQATLRHRMWYPTMCAAEGTLLDQCNIVRALHASSSMAGTACPIIRLTADARRWDNISIATIVGIVQ